MYTAHIMLHRIGLDLGGTSTDVAVLDADHAVLGMAKCSTTPDLISGMKAAIHGALQNAGIGPQDVGAVMLGTTAFVNALIQLRGLARVCVVRLCGPASRALPPFSGFPAHVRAAMDGGHCFLGGGFEYDGRRPISEPPNQVDADRIVKEVVVAGGIRSLVVCGVFSPINDSQEQAFSDILRTALSAHGVTDSVHITLSSDIGELGLLERESAAILNAALMPLAQRTMPAMMEALVQLGLHARMYLTGNDGTLLSCEAAQKLPIATLQSGPVNSVRGAGLLTGLQEAVVLDIGGTSTDAGVLLHGLPRPAGHAISVCGVRTCFHMPDVTSIALGGGSHVCWEQAGMPSAMEETCIVGSLSVGSRLDECALVAGGGTCTATDVAVLLGHMAFGDPGRVITAGRPSPSQLQAAWQVIQSKLCSLVDGMKVEAGDVPVVVVGGGAPLCTDDVAQLPGVARIIRPHFAAVANAVGAAIPQVAGSVDRVYELGSEGQYRNTVLTEATAQATAAAVKAGALGASCVVVEQEAMPLAYMPGGAARVRVKVVGNLDWAALTTPPTNLPLEEVDSTADTAPTDISEQCGQVAREEQLACMAPSLAFSAAASDEQGPEQGALATMRELLATHQQQFNDQGEWELQALDVEALAAGAQILGSGGGGSAHHGKLQLLQELRLGHTARVLPLERLSNDALVVDCGGMGAPTVSHEKLDAFTSQAAVEALARTLGRPLAALLCAEVGGGNCLEPLITGARMGLPTLDADLMGRAFPELQMCMSAIAGVPLTPCALADEKGNEVVISKAASAAWVERLMRVACDAMGGSAGLSSTPMDGRTAKQVVIPGSLSLAWRLGLAVLRARAEHSDPVAAVLTAYGGGQLLLVGKVLAVQQQTSEGFVRGSVTIRGQLQSVTSHIECGVRQPTDLVIDFQNEFLMARILDSSAPTAAQTPVQPRGSSYLAPGLSSSSSTNGGRVVCCTPDIICLLEPSGSSISTEALRYGLHVSVLTLPAHERLRTPQALKALGPEAFGYPTPI